MNARINNEWIRCANCGHKLGRIVSGYKHGNIVLEIKCSSCKTLNVYPNAPVTHRNSSRIDF